MFTSFSIDCSLPGSWLASRQTTSCPVLSWFVSSPTLKFVLSWEERVWETLGSWFVSRPTTGCPVLSRLTASSWKERVSISWERDVFLPPCAVLGSPPTTGCPFLSWSGIGFGWVNWEFFNCCTTCPSGRWATFGPNSFHPVMFQGDLGRRPRWRIYFLVHDFSSFHPNNFRNRISRECFVNNDNVRSSLIELQSFLQSKIWCLPNILCSDVSSMLYACIVHDAVNTSRSYEDPYGFCPWDPQAERILSVCWSKFDLQVSIPNWWWNVNWLHMRHDKMYWKKLLGMTTLSCKVGSMRLRLEWPWRACVGEGLVSWPHLLGEVAQGILLLNLREVEG